MRCFTLLFAITSSLFTLTAYANTTDSPATAADKPAPVALAAQPTVAPHPIHATLTLKQQGQRVYAYVIVEQSQNNNGKIRIHWTPPLHSSCDKSSYILSYHGKKFHTQAYRTLGYSLINGKSITCTGAWHAMVTDEQNQSLATAVINIESVDTYASSNAKMRSLAAIA